jgi:hypothetical protein
MHLTPHCPPGGPHAYQSNGTGRGRAATAVWPNGRRSRLLHNFAFLRRAMDREDQVVTDDHPTAFTVQSIIFTTHGRHIIVKFAENL